MSRDQYLQEHSCSTDGWARITDLRYFFGLFTCNSNSNSKIFKDEDGFITARVRSTTEGYVFTGVCLSTGEEGTYPRPDQDGGGVPTLYPGPDRGYPNVLTPSQVQMGVQDTYPLAKYLHSQPGPDGGRGT